MTDFAVETRQLRKVFNGRTAVKGLSLSVKRGEIFGFLGPNGAGKSTSIKMLLGLVRPTGGEGFVLGAPIGDVNIRHRIGFLPEDFRFYDWLNATELLVLHGRLAGMTDDRAKKRAPEVLDMVGMTPHAHRRLRGFSKGMHQRLGLAQALIHEPDIIFLDEPTSGLDPMGRRMVRDVIRAQRDRGATVFLNSHLLSEIEVTCDRVAFIKEGEVAAEQNLAESALANARRVTIRASNVSADAVAGLSRWSSGLVQEGDELLFDAESSAVLPEIVRHLVAAGADIFHVSPQPTSLEEVFMRTVGEDRAL
ncbi:MAG TPA: ABC transporter ATP-binding protein [Gemmatimonadaceae bacterium]|jgi:ABC-2 type transport system ATP-binding protein